MKRVKTINLRINQNLKSLTDGEEDLNLRILSNIIDDLKWSFRIAFYISSSWIITLNVWLYADILWTLFEKLDAINNIWNSSKTLYYIIYLLILSVITLTVLIFTNIFLILNYLKLRKSKKIINKVIEGELISSEDSKYVLKSICKATTNKMHEKRLLSFFLITLWLPWYFRVPLLDNNQDLLLNKISNFLNDYTSI